MTYSNSTNSKLPITVVSSKSDEFYELAQKMPLLIGRACVRITNAECSNLHILRVAACCVRYADYC